MDLHIEQYGAGERQVVLLHGWALHGGVFEPLIEALADTCTLHVVDLPGHGFSRDSALPLDPVACAEAIAARTPPALWLGWSMGGLIAQYAAVHHAAKVTALAVLCSSPCLVRRADWRFGVSAGVFEQLADDLDHGFQATLERFLALEALGGDRAAVESRKLRAHMLSRGEPDARILKQGLALLRTTDLRAELPGLSQASVWIAGARDRLVPWQAIDWAAGQCGGHFVRIPHAGHAPFIGHAAAVVEALEPLLEPARA